MEMQTDTAPVAPQRPTRSKSWIAALILGAALTLPGAASVFAASPSADPSASQGTTQSHDGGTTTDDGSGTTTDHQCPDRSDSDTSTDSSSSS